MKDKTNLITIIGSKQTKYNKFILEDKSLSEFNICIQNQLITSKIDFDKNIYNNVILIIYSLEDDIDIIKDIEKSIQKCSCRTNNIPTFILLEDSLNNVEDTMCIFATYGFTTTLWGGDTDFIEESTLINSLKYHFVRG